MGSGNDMVWVKGKITEETRLIAIFVRILTRFEIMWLIEHRVMAVQTIDVKSVCPVFRITSAIV